MSIVRQVEEVLTNAGLPKADSATDGFRVQDAGEEVAAVSYSGPPALAGQRLHEYAGPLEQAGFDVDRVGLPSVQRHPHPQ